MTLPCCSTFLKFIFLIWNNLPPSQGCENKIIHGKHLAQSIHPCVFALLCDPGAWPKAVSENFWEGKKMNEKNPIYEEEKRYFFKLNLFFTGHKAWALYFNKLGFLPCSIPVRSWINELASLHFSDWTCKMDIKWRNRSSCKDTISWDDFGYNDWMSDYNWLKQFWLIFLTCHVAQISPFQGWFCSSSLQKLSYLGSSLLISR